MVRRSVLVAGLMVLGACSGGGEKPDETPVEAPVFAPLQNLPQGTRVVARVDPGKTEAFQAAVMSRFDGQAPMPADLDVALAATNAAVIFPPQPTRLFATAPGRDPLPSLDRTRPIYYALTTEPALGFLDALRVGHDPLVEPSLGARLFLPAVDAEKLDREFGFYCTDARNQSLNDGCVTVASHEPHNGWVVVELDYGGDPARVRTSGATTFARDTAAVQAFGDDDAAVAIWFETAGAAEIGSVFEWYDYGFIAESSDDDVASQAGRKLEAMAPLLRSDSGARETEDVTLTLRIEGKNDIAVDAVRTFTQRGVSRADAGSSVVSPRSFDVKNPILSGELPWSMAGIRAATEPPVWSYGEAEYGRIGSGVWRRIVPWIEAPFAYYVGMAWGPRPSRSAGWLRVIFSLDGGRLRLDATADAASPWGFVVDGGTAVVSMGNESHAAVANVVEGFTQQAASVVASAYDFQVSNTGDRHDIVALLGTSRVTEPVQPGDVLMSADLARIADIFDASGNSGMFGPQLSAVLRAAGALELTWQRDGAAEAWRLHIGTADVASAAAVPGTAAPLLLEPLDACIIEARRAAVKSLRAVSRDAEPTPVDYADIANRCDTADSKRLLSPPSGDN